MDLGNERAGLDQDVSPLAFLSTSHLGVSNTRRISSLKDCIRPRLHGPAKDVCILRSWLPLFGDCPF